MTLFRRSVLNWRDAEDPKKGDKNKSQPTPPFSTKSEKQETKNPSSSLLSSPGSHTQHTTELAQNVTAQQTTLIPIACHHHPARRRRQTLNPQNPNNPTPTPIPTPDAKNQTNIDCLQRHPATPSSCPPPPNSQGKLQTKSPTHQNENPKPPDQTAPSRDLPIATPQASADVSGNSPGRWDFKPSKMGERFETKRVLKRRG